MPAQPCDINELFLDTARDVEKSEILDLSLELSDVLRESLEHVRPCVLVALQHGERAVPLYLEDACRDDAHGRAVTGHLGLEDHEPTEGLCARVKRGEHLAAALVEELHLRESVD